MSQTLQVVAIIRIQPGHADAVLAAFMPVISASRTEAGCHRYDLFVDQGDPLRFVMLEEWTSKEAMALHMTTPHFKELAAKIGALIDLDIIEMSPLA